MTRRTTLILLLSTTLAPAGAAQAVDSTYLNLLEWRSVGPSRGGRVVAVAGDPRDRMTFYQGTTGGGVWKTEDGGINWRNVSDGFVQTGSVGAIAVSLSDPLVVYVGMGEACFRGNSTHGDGMYRSGDGGVTWSHVGLAPTRQIGRVVVHPTDPNLVYVAALGDAWGPSTERGVYRSRDGGRTWQKILYRDQNTGAIDIVFDPSNPRVLYASLLQLRRFPWGFTSAGPGTGLFKTTDGGDNWTEITGNPGLPDGLKGRIGITVSPANPNRVWAIIDAELGKKGVFRSDDAGSTWTRTNENANLTQRPWYYHHIVADTHDANTVYVLNVQFWKSTDGGVTFSTVRVPHGDNHDLWIDRDDPRRMVVAHDGGASVTFNGGGSWSDILNQPTAQLYHVVTDSRAPYRLYASQQDNTSISVPSRSDFGSITIEDWYTIGGGEDGYIAVKTDDPDIIYSADHHWLTRYDHRTKQVKDISPNPETHYGWGSADINYRFWWTYPVMTSPHDPNLLYAGSQVVFRTRNEGQSWEVISPDLTRHDPRTLETTPSYTNPQVEEYWGPITREAYGPEWYATIFALAESPVEKGVIWAGSDDGYIHVTRDDGRTWTNVTISDLPEFSLISIIEPSAHAAGTAYVAATRYKLSDLNPYLYRTTDFGRTWTRINTGIPVGDFTRVIREDPGRPGLVFAGTERGVFVSFNAGDSWQRLQRNLPVVPVHDLAWKEGDLVAATHGRSFWIMDNVALLRQFTPQALAAPAHLFAPRTTVRWSAGQDAVGTFGNSGAAGQNPPDGVVVQWYLKSAPAGPVTVSLLKGSDLIRRYTSPAPGAPAPAAGVGGGGGFGGGGVARVPANAGANRFVWDLRYPPATVLQGAVFQGSPNGPRAAPGSYRVEVTVGGQTMSQPFTIVRDPRTSFTDAQLQDQFDFLIGVRDQLTETMNVVRGARGMRDTATARVQQVGGGAEPTQALRALNDKLYPLEERLVQYRARAGQDLIAQPTGIDSKLARLMSFAQMGDGPPTEGARALLVRLTEEVTARARLLEQIRANEYAAVLRVTGVVP
ncbi:MAG TPA: glycosyl hydrolase [Gemmatimonadales bacterium]|nr:glycosyl hydrolase [Gemmatimonadales bacterium]